MTSSVKFVIRLAATDESKVLAVGDCAEALLGYRAKDFLSASVSLRDQIHPHDANLVTLLFSSEIQPISKLLNIRLRHADGKIRCARVTYRKDKAPDGGLILKLLLQDAGSLYRHKRLASSLLALFENIPGFFFIKDRNHVFTYASKNLIARVEQEYGTSCLLGKTNYDIFPEKQADTFYRLEKDIFAGVPAANAVHQIFSNFGKKTWLDIRQYPLKDKNGKITGVFGITRDITARVEIEQSLRESEESLQEAQRIAGLGSYLLDIPSGKWAASETLNDILGIPSGYCHDVAGWTALIHPDDRDSMASYFTRKVLGERKDFDRRYRIIRQNDREVRWVYGKGKLTFDSSMHPVAMRGTIQDITEQEKAENALRENNRLLHLFIENAPIALAMLDREMRFVNVSRRWLEDYGLDHQKIIGCSYYEILPEIPAHWRELHRRALAGENISISEDRVLRENGKVQWLRGELRPWQTGGGQIGGITILSEDITVRKEAEEHRNLTTRVFAQASEGIIITDADGFILDVNGSFTRISGYSREEVLGKNPRILNSGRQSKSFYGDMWRGLREKGFWSGEVWNRAKDGHIYAELLTISALRNAFGKIEKYIGLFSDITSLKDQETKLEQAANYDLLTGLPNRSLLTEHLSKALAQAGRHGHRVALAYIDIDNFKVFNDRHGHSFGNKILTSVANNMKVTLRKEDTLARLGGDEFAVVLPENPETEGSWAVLTRLLKAASEPIQIDGLEVLTTVSAGITFFPQTDAVATDQLLRQADRAMCQAKLDGKNRYHIFDPSLDINFRDRRETIDRIHQALTANELVLYYQPKVNMRTGEVLGTEALIRWQHPQRGLIPPGEFLPVIEGHPLEILIGNWVFDSALTQMEQWLADGLDISVSVNVAAEHLQQADFVDQLATLLTAHPSVPPSRFEIEVLESSAIHDAATVSEVIRACKKLGVSFALDDFGTGYASLTYLKRLPVDVLKIDQTFVRDMLENPEDLSILEGMLAFATVFGCKAVAEGVESVEHGLMLLRLGCQVAQGYEIARPMQARDLPKWVSTWRSHACWKHATSFDPADRPVLYARVEHSAWIAAIRDFIRNKRPSAPALDIYQCRFGTWLRGKAIVDGEILPTRGGTYGFRTLDELHQQIHVLADEVLSLHDHGRHADAQARLAELETMRNSLFERLDNLLQP